MARLYPLRPGDPAPWFRQRTSRNASYVFDTAAGRYLVLCFFATAGDARGKAAIDAVLANRALFDDEKVAFFGVSVDPEDEAKGRVAESIPGLRYFWDFDGRVSKLYRAIPGDATVSTGRFRVVRQWIVLDPGLRVLKVLPFEADGSDAQEIMRFLRDLPPVNQSVGGDLFAPVILLPHVFEAAFCQHLVRLYECGDKKESGFMRDVDGKTVGIVDFRQKRRQDHTIADKSVIAHTQELVLRRIVPEIRKVHHFEVTRMERYIVACYTAEAGGHFRAHRDNTTKGTAHRRFAVSVNLNDDYEGGELIFPEYGSRAYRPPLGGAIVFSGSLLHMVAKVTRGRRYAFLPFLYDEVAARLRAANNGNLGEGVSAYRIDA